MISVVPGLSASNANSSASRTTPVKTPQAQADSSDTPPARGLFRDREDAGGDSDFVHREWMEQFRDRARFPLFQQDCAKILDSAHGSCVKSLDTPALPSAIECVRSPLLCV